MAFWQNETPFRLSKTPFYFRKMAFYFCGTTSRVFRLRKRGFLFAEKANKIGRKHYRQERLVDKKRLKRGRKCHFRDFFRIFAICLIKN